MQADSLMAQGHPLEATLEVGVKSRSKIFIILCDMISSSYLNK